MPIGRSDDRLWRLHDLQVPKKRRAPARCEHSAAAAAATGAGKVWTYLVFEACANGQQVKCLTVIEEYTRECLAIDVAGRIRSPRVIEVLTKLVSVHGAPAYLPRQRPRVRLA